MRQAGSRVDIYLTFLVLDASSDRDKVTQGDALLRMPAVSVMSDAKTSLTKCFENSGRL